MKKIKDSTVLVIDGGLFVELAVRLARDYGRVLYQCSIDELFPKVNSASIGEGLEGIETISDFWPIKDEIDLFVFPDCAHAGLQLELEKQGKAVWGSKTGSSLELGRLGFKQVLLNVGLEVGPYRVCHGLSELRAFLADKEDKYIKISKYRGCTETRHWVDSATSSDILDEFAITFGAVQELIEFIVEDSIPTEIEWGLDTFFCGGVFPNIVVHGPETKDASYIGAVREWHELPDEIKHVANAIAPVLASHNYANFFSMEVRIAKDGIPYFTDPTCRMPWPAGAPQLELYGNLSEIVMAGAHGVSVDPEPTAKFAAEAILDHKGDEAKWRKFVIPPEIRPQVKLYSATMIGDNVFAVAPFPHSSDAVGSVVGTGDSIKEAIEQVKQVEVALKGQPLEVHVDNLTDTLIELQAAEKEGIELTDQPIPEPAVVLESA